MPRKNITLSSLDIDLLTRLAKQSGESESGLAARLLTGAIAEEIKRRNAIAVYLKMNAAIPERDL